MIRDENDRLKDGSLPLDPEADAEPMETPPPTGSQPRPNGVTKPQSVAAPVSRPNWPDPPDREAFHGLAGRIVEAIEPHSEADPIAILGQLLVAFGNATGRGPFFRVESTRHYTTLWLVLVGATGKGRKGTSWGHVRRLFEAADPDWVDARVQGGLSSGEGLIWAVRDPIVRSEPVKEKGRIVEYQDVTVDEGVTDKRLLALESEFASVLKVAGREGNNLSAVARQAWDGTQLQTAVKNSPARAQGAHISIVGHITEQELTRYLDKTETANGFANRFLWLMTRRSKLLPNGGAFDLHKNSDLVASVQGALKFARQLGETEVTRNEEAESMWGAVYGALTEGRPGLTGNVIGRAEAQVTRLALVYALLDRSRQIAGAHLRAALALWEYVDGSVTHIFGDSLGDPVADEILIMLSLAGDSGMTRTEISDRFARNRSASEIGRALTMLSNFQLAFSRAEFPTSGAGRPAERWFSVGKTERQKRRGGGA